MNPMPPPPPPPAAAFVPCHEPNPPLPLPPSLTTALSDLTSFLDLTATILRSLPTPIQIDTSTASATFVPCPFNPNHRLLPSSLFSHYFNCPSPISLPYTFHYPHTLRSSSSTTTTATAPHTIPADSSDLTVPLGSYIGYNAPANSFFYHNCPGPVTPSIAPPSSLNLPRVLYIELADFNGDSSLKGATVFLVDFVRFLPSEIWAVRNETEAWGGGFPAFYSSKILRTILRMRDWKLLHLYDWLIVNSPRYGVIIDSAMRDHVIVLVKLCLKAIVGEAFELAGATPRDEELKNEEHAFSGLSNRSFECPVLVKVMTWLAFQFSVLYGEVNGKFLTANMLKECISDSALNASFFSLEGNDAEVRDEDKVEQDVEEPVPYTVSIDDSERDERERIKDETVGNSMIFISEVAAAVAALNERSLIEEKIKALRNSLPFSAYQRNMEHAHISKLAYEERQKRPDYRPIIEHDGFLRQRSTNQEVNKVKTRDELLAEERDYKRRRMSYRGKKVKRSNLEVMRDIIEEYMEEIRQAGGISGLSKAVEEKEASTSGNYDKHASATDVSGSRRNYETHEENTGRSVDYRKDLQSRHFSGGFKDDDHRSRQDSSWDYGRQYPNRNVESVRYDRDGHSRTRDRRKINSHAGEHMHVREKQDFDDAFAEDYSRASHQKRNESHDGKYSKRSRDELERGTHRRGRDGNERISRKRERDEDNQEHGDRGRRKTEKNSWERDKDKGEYADRRKSRTNQNSSFHRELREFEDRYDPAESHESYEDDF